MNEMLRMLIVMIGTFIILGSSILYSSATLGCGVIDYGTWLIMGLLIFMYLENKIKEEKK